MNKLIRIAGIEICDCDKNSSEYALIIDRIFNLYEYKNIKNYSTDFVSSFPCLKYNKFFIGIGFGKTYLQIPFNDKKENIITIKNRNNITIKCDISNILSDINKIDPNGLSYYKIRLTKSSEIITTKEFIKI